MTEEYTDLEECTNCPVQGACCKITVKVSEKVRIFSKYACPHLGEHGLCTRYDTRHEVPWCSAVSNASISWPKACAHHKPDQAHLMTPSEFTMLCGKGVKEYNTLREQVDTAAREQFYREWGVEL
jgi:hypothetical protein